MPGCLCSSFDPRAFAIWARTDAPSEVARILCFALFFHCVTRLFDVVGGPRQHVHVLLVTYESLVSCAMVLVRVLFPATWCGHVVLMFSRERRLRFDQFTHSLVELTLAQPAIVWSENAILG